MVHTVRVELGERGYPIHIGSGLLGEIGKRLGRLGVQGKVMVVSHPALAQRYGETLQAGLRAAGLDPTLKLLPEGEGIKALRWARRLYDALMASGMERRSTLIALGGGVIGDLAGFVAATFMRGIPYIQVPTTLIAQVDSSIGGKTAVNHPRAKNLIGVFYQPLAVFTDVDLLHSLPRRQLISGLAEVIKYGAIGDGELFAFLEDHLEAIQRLDPPALLHVIGRCCEMKAAIVGEDEREQGRRAILNFGHTVGHALEAVTAYRTYTHGEAVAMGMRYAADLSHRLGLCGSEVPLRLRHLLKQAGLPISPEAGGWRPRRLIRHLQWDKKVQEGTPRFILLKGIGEAVVQNRIDEQTLLEVLSCA